MDLTLSKKLFEEGVLLSASVIPAPYHNEKWLLMLNKVSGGQEVITISRTKNKKIYKRYTAAIKDAHMLGFNEVKIVLN